MIEKAIAQTHILNHNGDLRQKLFMGSLGLLGLLFVMYIYFVGAITFSVVERKTAENDLRALRAEVGQLELEYLSLNSEIDMEYAKSLGFKEANTPHFAKRPTFARR